MKITHHGRELTVTDAHAHIYPGKIAAKATASVGEFYGTGMSQVGYPHALVESGEAVGVCRYLVCSVATKPEQARAINDFIHAKCQKYPQFLGFAALHPAQADWEGELERVAGLGLRGVKFHPDFQRFNIDDPAMMPVYRKIRDCGLVVLFHMGDDRYDYSAPARLANLLDRVPGLTAIGAHFGGYRRWDDAARHLAGSGIWYDTSSTLWRLPRERAVELVRLYGADRMLFGTDFPMWDHETELRRFLGLGLTDAENDQILYQNFARLFGLAL